MVVALDEPTAQWCEARNVAHYTKVLTSRTGSTDNHATSGLKFKVRVSLLTIGGHYCSTHSIYTYMHICAACACACACAYTYACT